MFEPPQAVSFQRPVNSEKRKEAQRAGAVGCPFLAPSFGQAKEGDIITLTSSEIVVYSTYYLQKTLITMAKFSLITILVPQI